MGGTDASFRFPGWAISTSQNPSASGSSVLKAPSATTDLDSASWPYSSSSAPTSSSLMATGPLVTE